MRVLMVSDVYFPRVNGVSTSILTFRRELAKLGIEVNLIAPDYPNAVDEPGITRIPSRYLPFDPEDRMMRRSKLKALLPDLRRRGYALLHVQTPFVAHFAGLALAKALEVPAVTTYHTFFEEYLHHYAKLVPARLTRAFARRFSRAQCNATQGVIAPSQAMRDALLDYGVTAPIEIIPTGLPLDEFQPGDRYGFRAAHGIGSEREVALFVGRVAHEKNIDLLLHVADRVRRQRPAFLLKIAGEGPAQAHLRALADRLGLGGHVKFIGYLDRERALLDCYSAADVFVFSSTTETQGLVLLEAMAMGLPVVAIPAMGARDIVIEGRGSLCATLDADRFAERVLELLVDPQRRVELADRARSHAGQWNAPATAERMRAFYHRVLASRPQADLV